MALDDVHEQQVDEIDNEVKDNAGGDPPAKSLSQDAINRLLGAGGEGTSGIKQDVPKDLPFQPKPGQNNEKLRAQDQGWATQVAKTVGNLVPNVASSLLDMVGQIGNVPNFIEGEMPDDNVLTKAADKIRDPFGEVFQENPDKVFDWRDSASWLKVASGFVEGAASFALPGLGEAKGVEALADLIATGKASYKAVMAAGKTISAFGMGYLMSADAAKKVGDEAYKVNYDRFLAQGLDAGTADQKAKELAAKGSADAVGIGTLLNGALNLTALAPLFKENPQETIAKMFKSGEGAIKEGESVEQWKDRLKDFNPDVEKFRHGFSSHAFQATQVGLQGLNSEYAEKRGKEVGEGLDNNLNMVSDYLSKVSDSEGALNLLSGLLGGLTQNLILDHVPLNRVVKIDPSTNKPLLKDGAADEEGRYQTELVSARTRDIMGNRQYFESMKNAVMADITAMSDLKAKIATAKTPLEADTLRRQLTNVNNLNAVSMGMTENWQKVYDNIAGQDNTTDLSTQLQPQLDQLTQAIQEGTAQGQDVSELQKQRQDLAAQQDKLVGVSPAMQAGFASNMKDNSYKERAIEAKTDLQELQKIHDRLSDRFVGVTDPDQLKLQDHQFGQEANHYLMGRAIAKEEGMIIRDKGIVGAEGDYLRQQDLYNKVSDKIRGDINILKSADAKADFKAMGDLMSRYGVNAYSREDMRGQVDDLIDRIQKRKDVNDDRLKSAVSALHESSGFTKWLEKNTGKEFIDYHNEIDKQYPIDPRIQEREANLEVAKMRHEEQEQGLRELNSERGNKKFVRALQKTTDEFKKSMDAENKKSLVDLYNEQKTKEAAARLDKNQVLAMRKTSEDSLLSERENMTRLDNEFYPMYDRLKELQNKKGFFKNLQDIKEKRELRTRLAANKAELSLSMSNISRHERDIANLDGAAQDAAIKEDDTKNASREEVMQQGPVETVPVPQSSVLLNERDKSIDKFGSYRAAFGNTPWFTLSNGKSYEVASGLFTSKTNDEIAIVDKEGNASYIKGDTFREMVIKVEVPKPYTQNGQLIESGVKYQKEENASSEETPWPAEFRYAALQVAPNIQTALDNMEYQGFLDNPEFSRDQVYNTLAPFVEDQQISDDRADAIVEAMKDWWEEKKAEQPIDVPIQQPINPVETTDTDLLNEVSPLPEPDSPIISYAPNFNIDNAETSPILQEVGAKTLNAAFSLASASIKFDRIVNKETGKAYFVPDYSTLDPKFNANILKPNFIKSGDAIRFEVDTEWNGEINTDNEDVEDEYGKIIKREDNFGNYSNADGTVTPEGVANVPIKIVHEATGQKIGSVHRADWVTARRPDAFNYKNVEDNISNGDGTFTSGNVEAQKAQLLQMRQAIVDAHNKGEDHLKTTVNNVKPGHLFLSTEVNHSTGRSKMTPKLASNLIPDKKVMFGILDRGVIKSGYNSPFSGQANWDEKSLSTKYRSEGGAWSNTPMVLVRMPNGGYTESPLFTRQLAKRPSDIHTISKVIESYINHNTAKETAEHSKIVKTVQDKTGFDISHPDGLRNFINQYYTYTRGFSEADTRGNAEPGRDGKFPQFMLHIPDEVNGEKSKIKVGTSFSGVTPEYALDKNGNVNPAFDEALREGLATHYKNVVYTKGDLKGINDNRPITSITIQKDGKIPAKDFENYNEYAKSFSSTFVYGLHEKDGTYLYGANPGIEFDGNSIIKSIAKPEAIDEEDMFADYFTNAAISSEVAPIDNTDKVVTREDLVTKDNKVLKIDQIQKNISELYDKAQANPEQIFRIDIKGTRKSRVRLADNTYLTHADLGQMLADGKTVPYNVKFSDDLMSVIQNSPYKFRTEYNGMMYEDDSMYSKADIKPEILEEQLSKSYVPVRDAEGKHTGAYFSTEHQKEVVDSVIYMLSKELEKNKKLPEGDRITGVGDLFGRVKSTFSNFQTNFDRIANGEVFKGSDRFTSEQARDLGFKYQQVLNSFNEKNNSLSFWGEALKKIDALGMRVTREKFSIDEGTAGRRDVYNEAFTEDPMDSASGRMKMFIATTQDSAKNYLGLPKLVDYEKTYQDTMAALGDIPKGLDNYIGALKASDKPNLVTLGTNLETSSKQIQNEFVSVMTMAYTPFTMVLADMVNYPDGTSAYKLRTFNANRSSQLDTLQSHWQESQKLSPAIIKGANGAVINKELAGQLKEELDNVRKLFNSGDANAANKASDLMRKTLESNGIVLPEKAFQAFVTNTAKWTKDTSVAGGFAAQFGETKDGKPTGIISAFISKMLGKAGEDEEQPDENYQIDNPLYSEGTAMRVLAKVAGAFTPTLYSNSHRGSDGKNLYDWRLPSNLTNTFTKLKTDKEWRELFQDNDFAKRSWLLEHVHNNEDLRNRMSLSSLDAIKSSYGDGTKRTTMSDREQLLTSMGLFINGNSRFASYLSLTHSDKSESPIFSNMPRITKVTEGKSVYDRLTNNTTTKFSLHPDVIKRMYDVFQSEHDRINKASQVDYNDKKYNDGAKYFYALPQFNYDRMKDMLKEGKITELEMNTIWPMKDMMGKVEDANFKPTVEKILNDHVRELRDNTLNEWKEKGVIEGDKGVPFDRKYIHKLLSYVGMSGRMEDGKLVYRDNKSRAIVENEYIKNLSAHLAATDFAVNNYLFNVSLSQVFYGDPAQTWKGSVDKTEVEYGKRLAQFTSPKKEGSWDSPTYTSVVAKDFITHADYVHIKESYKDINATDAQELTTVLERLDTLEAYGRIDSKTLSDMKRIIYNPDKDGYYEFKDPQHIAVIFGQPEKPQYSGMRTPMDGAALNDYVKSSAYPLYPPLTKGREIDKLRLAMENNDVQRLAFESAKKVGIPKEPIKLFDENGRIDENVFKSQEWTGADSTQPSARQTLSRDNYGLSQENPYDEEKESTGIVSQMDKLVTGAIATIKTPFEFNDSKISGEQLALTKEDIKKQLVAINLEKFSKEAGADNKDGTIVMADKQKLYDKLIKNAQDDGSYSSNDLAILQHTLEHSDNLIVPIMYSPSATKFESLAMSMVNNMMRIDMPGKSYAAASSAGYRQVRTYEQLSDAEKSTMVRVGDWDGSELKASRLGEDGKVLPGQVIMPWPFTGSPKDYLDENNHLSLPLEALQIIAARIPNSGHNLMHAMEPVAFVPKEMGNLIIIPAALVRQMGMDFDFDKLYTYRRGYKQVEGKFVPDNEKEADLKTKYFDVHWSVLTHPEMLDRVMQPLDMEDLKDTGAEVEKWENKGKTKMSFYDPIYQLRDYQSQKDAKQLVGRSSLNVTFDSVIQDKDLPIGYYALEDEVRTPKTTPIRLIDEDGKLRELTHISGYGQSVYKQEGEPDKIRTKHDNHVMQQVEFLDYSKNRVSDKIHLTVHTYSASGALTQLQEADSDTAGSEGFKPGWAPSIKYNALLLSQPIVQEFSTRMATAQDTFTRNVDPNVKETIVQDLIKKYSRDEKFESGTVNYNNLEEAIKKGDKAKDYYKNQVDAIRLFKDLTDVGDQMGTAQGTINQDVNGAGANLLLDINKDRNRANLEMGLNPQYSRIILNATDIYQRKDGSLTEQGYLYKVAHDTAYSVVGSLFPYREMLPMFEKFRTQTGRTNISPTNLRTLFDGVKSYLFSHPQLGLWDKPDVARTRLLYGEKDGKSLAERVQIAKETWGKDNLLLQRLQPDIDPNKLRPDTISYEASKLVKTDMDENSRYWVDLLSSNDAEKRAMGNDLVQYSYITGGVQGGRNFVKYVPYSFLIGTDFGHKLRELTTNIGELATRPDFIKQVFQHEPQLAKQLGDRLKETGSEYEKYPERFSLPMIDIEGKNSASNLMIDGVRGKEYPEYLSYYSKEDKNWILYEKNGLQDYIRVDTLGDKQISEYSFDNAIARSLFPNNRSYAYDNLEPAFRMINGAISSGHGHEVLEDVGMPEKGGMKEMSEVLARLSTDKAVPDHSRVLASWLATIPDQHYGAMTALSDMRNRPKEFLPPFSFKVGATDSKWAAAEMDSFKNEMRIGADAIRNKGALAENLNHELLHYHTAAFTMLSEPKEYLEKRYAHKPEVIDYINRLREDLFEKHPEIKEAVSELNKVREQALDAIRKNVDDFDKAYDRVTKDGKIETGWDRYIYAASSNTEFISYAMTNTDFMRFLNNKEFKGGRSLLEKITDFVRNIVDSISKSLGTDVRKGSLLDAAVDRSLKLMMLDKGASMPTIEEMATPNNMEGQFTNAAIGSSVLTAMDRLVGKLKEQKEEIEGSLTGRDRPEAYADKKNKIDEFNKDIEALQANQSFETAALVGQKHIEWVDKVLKADNPSTAQIMTASRVLEVWKNLIDLVYGGNIDNPSDELAKVAIEAQKRDTSMLKLKTKALIDIASGAVQSKDFKPENLKDIGKGASLTRDLTSAAENQAVQFIGNHMQTIARHRDEDITRLLNETRKVEDELKGSFGKDLPGVYDKMFQENKKGDAWGLVQRYSQNWYDFRRDLRDKRKAMLKKVDSQVKDKSQAGKLKKEAWDNYWHELNQNAIFADTRKLFDRETGELKDDDEAKAHIKLLEDETMPETAKELISEAQDRYKQFLEHQDSRFTEIEADLESGTIDENEANRQKLEYKENYSPNAFFQSRDSKIGNSYGTDYYATMAPRSKVTGFYDGKYHEIQKDPKLKKFYDWTVDKMKELKEMLPVTVRDEHLGANFFPVVKKSLLNNMIDVPQYIRTMGERLVRDISATPFEESVNDKSYHKIPIDYVSRDEKANPIESRSKDIPRVIEMFGMMAMHYKHFSNAKDTIDMGESILKQLDQARTNGTTQVQDKYGNLVTANDGLKNTLESLKYMKDYVIYKKARSLEGKTDAMLYSLNPVKQMKASNEVKDLLAKRHEIEAKMDNGDLDPEEAVKQLGEVNDTLSKFGGTRIYGSKIGDKLITVNQLKTLSYNPTSGLANMTFGVISAMIHGNAGRDFTKTDFFRALNIMKSSMAKWLSLGSHESERANKILSIMDRAGVIGDIVDSRYGKVDIRDRKPGWQHAINPWNWMKSGDYFMKGLTTVAMMLHDKVGVTENGEKKSVSMFDAMDNDGKWDSKRFGENKEWYSDNVEDQKAWDKYRNKIVRVNMIIHGNQDKTSPKLANKFVLGRLLGQFRMSWLPEGWYSRFQGEKFDQQLDRTVEGRYRTWGHLGIGGSLLVHMKQLYSIIGKIDPFTNTTRLDGKGLNETDRENMRRNFAELGFIAGFVGMTVFVRALAADSDDEKTAAAYRYLMNTIIRNKQDLEFYTSPQVFDAVTKDIIPAAQVLKDFGKAMMATGKLMFNDNYEFQTWLLAMTHAGLPVPQATQINKLKYMFQKDIDNSQY